MWERWRGAERERARESERKSARERASERKRERRSVDGSLGLAVRRRRVVSNSRMHVVHLRGGRGEDFTRGNRDAHFAFPVSECRPDQMGIEAKPKRNQGDMSVHDRAGLKVKTEAETFAGLFDRT